MFNQIWIEDVVNLARIKAACRAAIVAANSGQFGAGMRDVCAADSGKVVVRVVARRGGVLEFFDREDNDVTDVVLAAFRAYHAERRQPVTTLIPLLNKPDYVNGVVSFPYGREALQV